MNEPTEPARPRHSAEMNALLGVIRAMVGEVHPHWKNLHFTPHTLLEKELGLDSMARAELQLRIERDLQVALAENARVCAATPHDLLKRRRDPAYRPCPGDTGASNAAELLMGSFENPANHGAEQKRDITDWLYAIYTWPVFVTLALLAWVLLHAHQVIIR